MAIEMLRVGKCGSGSAPVRLIKGDNNTQLIQMQVQRYFGGVDLSALAWSVTVENAKGATDEYYVAHRSGEYVIDIEWIVKDTATAAAGLAKFKLSGYGGENLVWQSGTYFIRVEDTIEHVPGNETETALTEVQKLIVYVDGELKNVIAAGNDARTGAAAANAAAQRAEDAAYSANSAAGSANSAASSANGAAKAANTAADAANAVSGIITNEFKGLVDRLTTPFAEKGGIVTCHPVEGYPLEVKTFLEPVQAGSGEASPDNVRPIAGHTGAKVTRCGKNLLKPYVIDSQYAGFQSSGDGIYTCHLTENTLLPEPFLFKAGQTYTISLTRVSGTGNNPCIVVRNPSGDTEGQRHNYSNPDLPLTFAFDADMEWDIMLQSQSGKGYTTVGDSWAMQVETGSAATAYEPYQGETFYASFGQTVYGGTLDWNTGELTVDRVMVTLDGSQTIYHWPEYNSFGVDAFDSLIARPLGDAIVTEGICDAMTAASATDVFYATGDDIWGISTNASALRFYASRFGTAEEWTAYFAANPVHFVVPAAEPYTIRLTPAQILALKGENNLWSDAGDTEVSGATDPEYLTGTGGGNANITINGTQPDKNGNFIINTLNDVEIAQLQAVMT